MQRRALERALPVVAEKAKGIPQILEKAQFILTSRPIRPDEKAAAALDDVSRGILKELTPQLLSASWTREGLEDIVKVSAEAHGLGLGKMAQPIRAALAGRSVTPSVFDMMLLLGRDETIARLQEASETTA